MGALVVITTLPDPVIAEEIARVLIDQRLSACVSILGPCQSVYRWQGLIQASSEVPLLIKTTDEAYPALEQEIRRRHPYELPEILAIPVVGGLPAYLDWVAAETNPGACSV